VDLVAVQDLGIGGECGDFDACPFERVGGSPLLWVFEGEDVSALCDVPHVVVDHVLVVVQ